LGVYAAQRDPQILDFIRKSHETATWTVGICNGVEILATAGILNGVEVTTNYFARDRGGEAWRQGAENAVSPRREDRHRGRCFCER
jgi:putative intracellular protease/amidase